MTQNARSVLYPRKPLSTSYGSVIMLKTFYMRLLTGSVNIIIIHIHVHLEEKSFLFGLFKNQDNEVNKLVLMEIKYYIYFAKCSKNNLRLSVLKQRLKLVYQTQQYASILENRYETFQVKWQNFHNLFI